MVNSKSLQDLLPPVRSLAVHFIAVAEMELSEKLLVPVKVRVTSTYRDAAWQDKLYAQGRSDPGKIVTRARGGESIHQYRCAFDTALELDGKVTWDASYYRLLGAIAQRIGLTWGGDFNANGIKDPEDFDLCHFQYTGGLTLVQLRAGEEVPVA